MRYLLDTHVFIWLDGEPDKLSSVAAAICADVNNALLFSIASVWEMQIKSQLGKLALRLPLADLVQSQNETNLVRLLPIELAHILALANLPPLSRDPFDRLLIAQALTEDTVLVSHDPNIRQYPVRVEW
jgi:PIN domain nuclease of toxin-antitoxin system